MGFSIFLLPGKWQVDEITYYAILGFVLKPRVWRGLLGEVLARRHARPLGQVDREIGEWEEHAFEKGNLEKKITFH
jgi:hypothetical protein